MDLNDGRVQRHRFDLDTHHLFPLQLLEEPVQHPALRPAVHAGIDGVPMAETFRQPAPLAALLGHIQDRVQYLQIGQPHVATLTRKNRLNSPILRFCDLH